MAKWYAEKKSKGLLLSIGLFFMLHVLCKTTVIAQDQEAIQEVVVEGVGTTPSGALKDAFRNAVSQVVGAVVEANTLIQNDQVIDDKILTYSDGFITKYQEVAGSKKEKDGLHRIKIKAQVERRSVIAKLKAANVSMKHVDGKGLFAETVTQLDAEKDSAALIGKQFEGFPQSYLTATIFGKPKIIKKDADRATIEMVVQIEPDLIAFKAFSTQLTSLLAKIAKSKGEFTAKFKRAELNGITSTIMTPVATLGESIPSAFTGVLSRDIKGNMLTIAIATNRTKVADSIDYKVYFLDGSLQAVFASIASRKGVARLQLVDGNGNSIVTERLPLEIQHYPYSYEHSGTLISSFGGVYGDGSEAIELGLSSHNKNLPFYRSRDNARLFVVGSTFPQMAAFGHMPQLVLPCKFSLSLEELKSIQDAKVEINFDE